MRLSWKSPFRLARALWHAFIYWLEDKPVIAPKAIVAWRRSVCAKCLNNDRKLWASCSACSCFIQPKTQLASESCPLGKWPAL